MYLLREVIDIPCKSVIDELAEAKKIAEKGHIFSYKTTLEIYKAVDTNLHTLSAFKKPGQDWVELPVDWIEVDNPIKEK